nr:hypothetical protein CFP56_02558 [Quercus suber]
MTVCWKGFSPCTTYRSQQGYCWGQLKITVVALATSRKLGYGRIEKGRRSAILHHEASMTLSSRCNRTKSVPRRLTKTNRSRYAPHQYSSVPATTARRIVDRNSRITHFIVVQSHAVDEVVLRNVRYFSDGAQWRSSPPSYSLLCHIPSLIYLSRRYHGAESDRDTNRGLDVTMIPIKHLSPDTGEYQPETTVLKQTSPCRSTVRAELPKRYERCALCESTNSVSVDFNHCLLDTGDNITTLG